MLIIYNLKYIFTIYYLFRSFEIIFQLESIPPIKYQDSFLNETFEKINVQKLSFHSSIKLTSLPKNKGQESWRLSKWHEGWSRSNWYAQCTRANMIFAKIETEVDSLGGDQSIRLPSNPFHSLPLVEKSAAILSAPRVIVSTDLNRLVERKDSSVFFFKNLAAV